MGLILRRGTAKQDGFTDELEHWVWGSRSGETLRRKESYLLDLELDHSDFS